MSRPPRAPDEPLFSGFSILWSLLQGTAALVLLAALFIVALGRGMPDAEVRALTFFSLVVTIFSLIFVNRAFSASLITALRRPNPALVWVLFIVASMLSLTLLWPFARDLFRFGPLDLVDLALALGAGAFALGFLEVMKLLYVHWHQRPSHANPQKG